MWGKCRKTQVFPFKGEKLGFSPLKQEAAGREQTVGRGQRLVTANPLGAAAQLWSCHFLSPRWAGAEVAVADRARAVNLSCARILMPKRRRCLALHSGQAGPSYHSTEIPSHAGGLSGPSAAAGPGRVTGSLYPRAFLRGGSMAGILGAASGLLPWWSCCVAAPQKYPGSVLTA